MKRTELNPGVLYAVRNQSDPHLLLSATVHLEFRGHGTIRYRPAPDKRPRRDQTRSWGFDTRNYGFLFLVGPAAALGGLDVAALLARIHAAGQSVDGELPELTYVSLVTSLATVEGPYDAVMESRRVERDAKAERGQRAADEWNEVIDALNTVLGDDGLYRRYPGEHRPEVELSLSQARKIVAALAVVRAEVAR